MLKTNLMVFIRPKIIRDAEQSFSETHQKYNYIRDLQLGSQGEAVPLMPGESRPMLPPIDLRGDPVPEDSGRSEQSEGSE